MNVDQEQQQHQGAHAYILVSPKTDLIKIGGTAYPPLKRIREVNGSSPYRELGPWSLSDFRQVTDWRKVEAHLHFALRSQFREPRPSGVSEVDDLAYDAADSSRLTR